MQRIRTFSHFLNEASNQDVQNLIAKLQSEAASEKMRIGGTEDKLPWAMKFTVLMAFVQQLQNDLAANTIQRPNYDEDLYNSIEGRSTELKQKAIELLTQNGLSPEAAAKLNQTPAAGSEPEGESDQHYDDGRDAYVGANGVPGPNAPKNPVPQKQLPPPAPTQESRVYEGWTLVKVLPETLKAEKKRKRNKVPKSPAEKEFRTAFNHARNEARKILSPKPVEPVQPTTPAPQPNPPVQNVVQ